MYYLYVKTHSITGLKYLGYTSAKDPYKYRGSGKYWKSHLSVHGNNITTEILIETLDKSKINDAGIYYSNLWDVVSSDKWANLKIEIGDGGFNLSQESVAKRLETRKRLGKINTNTPESIAKSILTKTKNGTLNNHTQRVSDKIRETKIKNGTLNNKDIIKKAIETKIKNGTLNVVTKESIAKAINTRAINGTLNTITPASIEKANSTKKEKGVGVYERITCQHCGLIYGKPQYIRWHGNNCKLKGMV